MLVGSPGDGTNAAGTASLVFGRDFGSNGVAPRALTATNADQSVIGGLGDDTLSGGGFANTVLRGGKGNDTLVWFGNERRLDGGTGVNTLTLALFGQNLDLTTLQRGKLTRVERIDMRGNGVNELKLNRLDLLNLSASRVVGSITGRVLCVRGDAADRVSATQAVWWASGLVNFEGVNYNHFLVPNTTGHLLVEDVMNPTGIAQVDTDGDGLPDTWESQYFGGATNAAAGADGDNDGMSNLKEYLAGSNPTNRLSVLKFAGLMSPGTNQFVVQWASETGRLYDLVRATNLLTGFAPLTSGIPAMPPLNTYTDTVDAIPSLFYRIRVR
jgi:hypothetical protein